MDIDQSKKQAASCGKPAAKALPPVPPTRAGYGVRNASWFGRFPQAKALCEALFAIHGERLNEAACAGKIRRLTGAEADAAIAYLKSEFPSEAICFGRKLDLVKMYEEALRSIRDGFPKEAEREPVTASFTSIVAALIGCLRPTA